jgi:hypothetical protein
MPAGPWLAVLGMHRSGTSALAGALGELGFGVPHRDDRMDWPESNPEHWESSALTVYDDDVLADLGGSWDAPPELSPGWETSTAIRADPRPDTVARRAFPDPGPIVWKDPRLCLLLPFWRRFLPRPLAAVLIWRSPLDVARSLRRRDGMHLAEGVALWEHYNRSALRNLTGLDTYICRYESLLADPRVALTAIAGWLSTLPQFGDGSGHWDVARATATVTEVGATPGDTDGDGLLLPPQEDLVSRLGDLVGGHHPLDPGPPGIESPWATALLGARRGSRTRELVGVEAQVHEKQTEIDRLRASTSWRVTAPLRAVIARTRSAKG